MEKNFILDYTTDRIGVSQYFSEAKKRNLVYSLIDDQHFYLGRVFSHLSRKYAFLVNPTIVGFFFGKWVKKLDEVTEIVLVNQWIQPFTARWLAKHYPEKKIRVLYLNAIGNRDVPITSWDRTKCEIYTFDPSDAEKYNLKKTVVPICLENFSFDFPKPDVDVVFVGEDKARKKQLLALEEDLQASGLITDFYIKDNQTVSKTLAYQEVIKRYSKARAILEILTPGQSGSTMRPIEAGLLKRKLITNNVNIVYEEYYNPQNIFILGKDDFSFIKQFINSSFVESFDYNKYDVENWLADLK